MKSEDESYFVSLSRCSRKIGCNRVKTLRSFPSLEIGIDIVSFNTSVISNFGVPISFPKALERSTCVYRNWWHIISVHFCSFLFCSSLLDTGICCQGMVQWILQTHR